jgi:hypothetical protein
MPGIEEVKDVISVAAAIGNATGKVLQDDRFDWGELVEFVPALIALPEAVSGISHVPSELLDLDEAEKEQLKKFLIDEFDIPQRDLETVIEDHAKVIIDLWDLVKKYYLRQ